MLSIHARLFDAEITESCNRHRVVDCSLMTRSETTGTFTTQPHVMFCAERHARGSGRDLIENWLPTATAPMLYLESLEPQLRHVDLYLLLHQPRAALATASVGPMAFP